MAGFAFFFDSLIIVSNFDFQLAWASEVQKGGQVRPLVDIVVLSTELK